MLLGSRRGEDQEKDCDDDVSTPVGYAWGILWDTDRGTGQLYKAMERYQKGGEYCQQTFNAKGEPEPEHCESKLQ